MPSGTDFFNQLKHANEKLDTLNGKAEEIRVTLESGFGQLVALEGTQNDAIFHQIQQLDTIICLLKQISDHTCRLLNESHIQTGLQTGMSGDTRTIADLVSITHPEAALVRGREEALRKEIEACCPPPEPEPACRPEACKEPGPFKGPVILSKPPKGRSRGA